MKLKHIIRKLKTKLGILLRGTSYTRIQLNDWLKTISVDVDRVLEVGASLNPVITKVKSWKVTQYKTLDNNLEVECNPDFPLDLNLLVWSDKKGWMTKVKGKQTTLNKALRYKPQVLFCLEVMEYIYKPETVLKFFHDVLAPGGILYISFHTIYPIHKPKEYDSLRFTKWGIMRLLKDVGFTSLEITPRAATKGRDSLRNFFKNERMHALWSAKETFDIGSFVKATK